MKRLTANDRLTAMPPNTTNSTLDERLTTIFINSLNDPNERPKYSCLPTPIYHAIAKNNPVMVTTLLELGADPNPLLEYNEPLTPLMFATRHKYVDIIEILLDQGSDPNFLSDDRITALDMAIGVRSHGCVRLLLEYGAYVNREQREYDTGDEYDENDSFANYNHNHSDPIKLAIQSNSIEIVKLLMDYGEDIKDFTQRFGITVFNLAMSNIKWHVSCINMMEFLISIGADVNENKGNTPLSLAIRMNKIRYVKFLLEAGVNINHIDSAYHYSPLSLAIVHGFTDIVKYLLVDGINIYGLDVNLVDAHGWTAGHHLVANMFNFDILKMLLDLNIDFDVRTSRGYTMIDLVRDNHMISLDDREHAVELIEKYILPTKGVIDENDKKN